MMKSKRSKRPDVTIPTSALPDIVFMLLFFFMVVTVIKEEDHLSDINVPEVVFSKELKSDKANEIIFGIDPSFNENAISINGTMIAFNEIQDYLSKRMKILKHEDPLKAILYIDAAVKMKQVNELKLILQNLNIYKVEYISVT